MWLKHRFELYYLPSSLYLIFFVSTKLKKFSSKLNNCTLGYHQCHLIASIKQQFHLSRIDLHWLYFSKTFPKQNTKEILIDETMIASHLSHHQILSMQNSVSDTNVSDMFDLIRYGNIQQFHLSDMAWKKGNSSDHF